MKKVSKMAIVIVAIILLSLIVLLKVIFTGERLAENYVKFKGYKIVSVDGEVRKQKITKEYLLSMNGEQTWMVQKNSPDKYIGKEVAWYGFTVTNHPFERNEKIGGKETKVWVMVCGNRVIGGISAPLKDGQMPIGGVYSLEGRTQEEVTGVSFNTWLENWKKKYSD